MTVAPPRGRAPLFEDKDALDVSGFAPRAAVSGEQAEQVRAIAEPAAFRSRDPAAPTAAAAANPATRAQRRYRTGRNMQLNLKVRETTATVFYAMADAQGWVLGEAFEHAVAALQRELAK